MAISPPIIEIIGFHNVDIADSQLTKEVVAKAFAVVSVSFIGERCWFRDVFTRG
jgi:hypothetical protein